MYHRVWSMFSSKLIVVWADFNPNYVRISASVTLPSLNARSIFNVSILEILNLNKSSKDSKNQVPFTDRLYRHGAISQIASQIFDMSIRAHPLLSCTWFALKNAEKAVRFNNEKHACHRHLFTLTRELCGLPWNLNLLLTLFTPNI